MGRADLRGHPSAGPGCHRRGGDAGNGAVAQVLAAPMGQTLSLPLQDGLPACGHPIAQHRALCAVCQERTALLSKKMFLGC